MDIHAIATAPIFVLSLVFCGLVSAYAITLGLFTLFRKLSSLAVFAGLSREELISIEAAGIFHAKLEILLEKVLSLEQFSQELPEVFHDQSWRRLLKICDDLELVRAEFNQLLAARDFQSAAQLGQFICGKSFTTPEYPRQEDTVPLRPLTFWQRDSMDLLHRMVTKLEDACYNHNHANRTDIALSRGFVDTVESVKAFLEEEGILR